MGSEEREEEGPVHEVRLDAYRLARTQVTNEQYRAFLEETGHEEPRCWDDPLFSHPRQPVVGASWNDAMAFCAWYSERTGDAVGLPTEAEWERAARADRDARYPWGDAGTEGVVDYERRWLESPEPVDAYPSPHPWGFLGLGENVHEWCADWFQRDYYAVSPCDNPRGPAEGRRRASRGGSWRHAIRVSRCAARSAILPHFRYADYGFRLRAPA